VSSSRTCYKLRLNYFPSFDTADLEVESAEVHGSLVGVCLLRKAFAIIQIYSSTL
jgi:hypothetical protein